MECKTFEISAASLFPICNKSISVLLCLSSDSVKHCPDINLHSRIVSTFHSTSSGLLPQLQVSLAVAVRVFPARPSN